MRMRQRVHTRRRILRALHYFAFECGGCAVFEARVHVKHGLQRISRRGPSAVVGQEDIVYAVQWRKERLARDGIKYQQVSPTCSCRGF